MEEDIGVNVSAAVSTLREWFSNDGANGAGSPSVQQMVHYEFNRGVPF
eukprot:SAG31_NODE_4492_length_3188_cov_3.281716_5_plen_48_part_00